jgi:CRP/FNR family transcriptional regulator, cyclic AMP receptor protein
VASDPIVEQLRGSPLFAHVGEGALVDVARHLRRRRYRRGEVIFEQGDPGDALHLVRSGAVKIVLPQP